MTLPLAAQGLYVWKLQLYWGKDSTYDFDLRTPAIQRSVVVGINRFPLKGRHEVHIGEADGGGGYDQFIRFRDVGDQHLEGRSVVRTIDGIGYLVAGVRYTTGSPDSVMFLFRWDTSHTNVWAQQVRLADPYGLPYETVMPTKVINYRGLYYLVGGYGRIGGRQDAFLLKVDDQGAIGWVMIYRDVATPDHDKSPLWLWDLEAAQSSGEVVLVGSRVTLFRNALPDVGCLNERQQAWMVVVDGNNGTLLSNGIYAEYKDQCTELKKVRVAEEMATGKQYVLSCGWGTHRIPGTSATITPLTYNGELGNLAGGNLQFQMTLVGMGGNPAYEQFRDLEYWMVQDTVQDMLAYVGSVRDSSWYTPVGQCWDGFWWKAGKEIHVMQGFYYGWGQPQPYRLRHMEKVEADSALYLLGYDVAISRAVLWKTEGRVFRPKGEVVQECRTEVAGAPDRPFGLYQESMEALPGSVIVDPLQVELLDKWGFGIECSGTLD